MRDGVYSNSFFSLSLSFFYVRIKLNVNDFDGDSSLSWFDAVPNVPIAIVHMTQYFFSSPPLENFKLKFFFVEGAFS